MSGKANPKGESRLTNDLYMKVNPDGKTVRAMDVLVPGIWEFIGGAQREAREEVLLERIAEIGMPADHL